MICLYANNKAFEVLAALESAFTKQTCPPAELVAIFDGPVPNDVSAVIEEFATRIPVTCVTFSQNMGHGPARAAAIEKSSYVWMAIIDSDDISSPDRFETLLKTIDSHPDSAVVGGGLTEFTDSAEGRVVGKLRLFPENPEDVARYIQSRAPVAQPTAILRVQAVLDVGNYQTWYNNEDYHLWIRLVRAGYEIRNVPKSVLLFRTSPDLYARRGGLRYWWNEVSLQAFSLSSGTTVLSKFLLGAVVRFGVQVVMPGWVRSAFYNKFLRR